VQRDRDRPQVGALWGLALFIASVLCTTDPLRRGRFLNLPGDEHEIEVSSNDEPSPPPPPPPSSGGGARLPTPLRGSVGPSVAEGKTPEVYKSPSAYKSPGPSMLDDILRGTTKSAINEDVGWDDIEEEAEKLTKMGMPKDESAPKFTSSRINALRRKGILPKLKLGESFQYTNRMGSNVYDPNTVVPRENATARLDKAMALDQEAFFKELAEKDKRGPGVDFRDDYREEMELASVVQARFKKELEAKDAYGKARLPGKLTYTDEAHIQNLKEKEKREEFELMARQEKAVQGYYRAKRYVEKFGREAYEREVARGRDFFDAEAEALAEMEERRTKELAFAESLPKETYDSRGLRLYPEETLRAEHITMPHLPHQLVPRRRFPGKSWLNKETPEAPGYEFVMNAPDGLDINTVEKQMDKKYSEDDPFGIFPGIFKEYEIWREERMRNESKSAEGKKSGFRALQRLLYGDEDKYFLHGPGKENRDRRRLARMLGALDISEDPSEVESDMKDLEQDLKEWNSMDNPNDKSGAISLTQETEAGDIRRHEDKWSMDSEARHRNGGLSSGVAISATGTGTA